MKQRLDGLAVFRELLKDGAVLARRTMDGFTPVFTRESYIETVRRQG